MGLNVGPLRFYGCNAVFWWGVVECGDVSAKQEMIPSLRVAYASAEIAIVCALLCICVCACVLVFAYLCVCVCMCRACVLTHHDVLGDRVQHHLLKDVLHQ